MIEVKLLLREKQKLLGTKSLKMQEVNSIPPLLIMTLPNHKLAHHPNRLKLSLNRQSNQRNQVQLRVKVQTLITSMSPPQLQHNLLDKQKMKSKI